MDIGEMGHVPQLAQAWVFWARCWGVRNQRPAPLGEYQVLIDSESVRISGPKSIDLEMASISQIRAAGSRLYGGSPFFESTLYRVALLHLEGQREIEILLVDPLNPVDSPERGEERRDFIGLVNALRTGQPVPDVERRPYRRRATGRDLAVLVERQLIDSMMSPWELVATAFPWRRALLPYLSVRKALIQVAVILVLVLVAGLALRFRG